MVLEDSQGVDITSIKNIRKDISSANAVPVPVPVSVSVSVSLALGFVALVVGQKLDTGRTGVNTDRTRSANANRHTGHSGGYVVGCGCIHSIAVVPLGAKRSRAYGRSTVPVLALIPVTVTTTTRRTRAMMQGGATTDSSGSSGGGSGYASIPVPSIPNYNHNHNQHKDASAEHASPLPQIQDLNKNTKIPYSLAKHSVGPTNSIHLLLILIHLALYILIHYLSKTSPLTSTWMRTDITANSTMNKGMFSSQTTLKFVATHVRNAVLLLIPYTILYYGMGYRRYKAQLCEVDELRDYDCGLVSVTSHGVELPVYTRITNPNHEETVTCTGPEPEGQGQGQGQEQGQGRSPMILLHGFGSWLITYSQVQAKLAKQLQRQVVSFDRPGFGITPRQKVMELERDGVKVYSDAFCGDLALALIAHGHRNATKGILVGHSMNAKSVLLAAQQRPDTVKALILIAPAVMMFTMDSSSHSHHTQHHHTHSRSPGHSRKAKPISWTLTLLLTKLLLSLKLLTLILVLASREILFKLLSSAIPLIAFMLRVLVSDPKFWKRGLQSSVFDPKSVNDYWVAGYRRPDRVIGWDTCLAQFVAHSIRSEGPLSSLELVRELLGMWSNESTNPVQPIVGDTELTFPPIVPLVSPSAITKLFHSINNSGIPIIIIHGQQDPIIPVSNSVRMAQKLKHAKLVVVDQCGHQPHEEMPDRFVQIVSNFVDEYQL